MALKNRLWRVQRHYRGRGKDGRPADPAELLAPPEEQQQGAAGDGSIVVDTGRLRLPKGVVEDGRGARWRPEPVVVVILIIMLAFIGFIAYLISTMPPAK